MPAFPGCSEGRHASGRERGRQLWRLVAWAAWMVSAPALAAPGADDFPAALAAFDAGRFEEAAFGFHTASRDAVDPEVRARAQLYLPRSLQQRGMPFSAMLYYGAVLQAGKAHPGRLTAVEALVGLQGQLGDQELIPNQLSRAFDDDWSALPASAMARVNYLVGLVSYRRGRLDEARAFLEAVSEEAPVYAQAQYLLGVALADSRHPGGALPEEAARAFERAAKRGSASVKELAQLARGRLLYGQGRFADAALAYAAVPPGASAFADALAEGALARFQADDSGGSLGALQALSVPRLWASAFQPERYLLEATVYHAECLYERARGAAARSDALVGPWAQQLEKAMAAAPAYRLLTAGELLGAALPAPIQQFVGSGERMRGLLASIEQVQAEQERVLRTRAWSGTELARELSESLAAHRELLVQRVGALAQRRLEEVRNRLKRVLDDAEIIRFEAAKAEKELAERGVELRAAQAPRQGRPGRPDVPGESFTYWPFQGEYWADEVTAYQATLRRACP